VEITEDTMAGTNDRRGFAIDENSERIPVTCQDSVNRGALILVLSSSFDRCS
jgi:hypothetical protein